MHKTVKESFRRFNEPLEGLVEYMYLDIKGFVTVGVGFLIDPISEARRLPFRKKSSGEPATPEEINEEWRRIKNTQALARSGHIAAAALTNLRLSDADIDTEIDRRLTRMEATLLQSGRLKQWLDMLPQVQMAVMSMCWAVGPTGLLKFEKFLGACEMSDFEGAARECLISEVGNPGIRERNRKNAALLRNAAETRKLMI